MIQDKLVPDKQFITQGAEAKLYKYILNGKEVMEKERFSKIYRHPLIDSQTRKKRTQQEKKIMLKLNTANIPSPQLIDSTDFSIVMEFIEGYTLTQLYNMKQLKEQQCIMMGSIIRQLHDNSVIHNDLTTSNFIYSPSLNKVFVIDFGLANTQKINHETKAVDLFVLEKSIDALTGDQQLFKQVLLGYQIDDQLLQQLEIVRGRGRKK